MLLMKGSNITGAAAGGGCRLLVIFFFITIDTGPDRPLRLELSDTNVYDPCMSQNPNPEAVKGAVLLLLGDANRRFQKSTVLYQDVTCNRSI